jgi:nucleotide-binding universal stress UspA family protein
MLNRNRTMEFESRRVPVSRPERRRPAGDPRYEHIAVPTSFAPLDRPALLFATELAALHAAKLTVLHILPPAGSTRPAHSLEAIGLLHQAVGLLYGTAPVREELASPETARRRVKNFFESAVPAHLRQGVDLRVECATGDLAEKIVRFADEAAADVVVLSSGPSRWWLPVLPAHVRRVLQRARQKVILVRPSAGTDAKEQLIDQSLSEARVQ